jgi:superfamily I DNA/RNA helicase
MNKGFLKRLSVEEQQFVNKIILFVNANTKLRIEYQENFIKFGFSLNDPSIFYISKNTNGKVFVKFKVIENVSDKPDEKEFLPEATEKVLKYIKSALGYKKSLFSFLEDAVKINRTDGSKSPTSANEFSYIPSNRNNKIIDKNSIQKEKWEDLIEFLKDVFTLNIKKEKNYDLWYIKPFDQPLASISNWSGKSPSEGMSVINLLDPLAQIKNDKNIYEVDSKSDLNTIGEKIYQYLDRMNKIINPFVEGSTEIPKESKFDEKTIELNEEESISINEEFISIDKKIDLNASRPRKIFVSVKFKKSIEKLTSTEKEKVFSILQEIEKAPMGAQFLKFIKTYQINKIFELFKIRVDDVSRIVFKYFHYQGFSAIKIVDYISDHEFDYLKDVDSEKLSYSLWTSNNSLHYSKVPFLNDEQRKIAFSVDYPSIVFGAAGSGKTSISLEKYVNIYRELVNENKSIKKENLCYLTFNYKMAEDMSSQIRLFYPNSICFTVDDFFQDLLGSAYKIQSNQNFFDWFKLNISNAFDSKTRNLSTLIGSDNPGNLAYTYYRGLYKGSLNYDKKLNMFDNDIPFDKFKDFLMSETFEISRIEALWTVFQKYDQYILSNNLFHDNNIANLVIKNGKKYFGKFENIIVDETQDLTQLQIYVLLVLSNNFKVYFFGDSNQTINPTLFSLGKLRSIIHNLSNSQTQPRLDVLNKTYRATKGLVEYTNYLVDLRKEWIAAQSEEVDYHHFALNEDSEFRWAAKIFNPKIINYVIDKTLINPNAIILVPNNEVKIKLLEMLNVKDELQNRIYTIFEAKGLEWESVVLYKFVSEEIQMFRDMIGGKAKRSTIHRMIFNKYYVACTRARGTTLILEDFEGNDIKEKLFSSIHEINDEGLLDLYFNKDISPLAWYKEAVNLFDQFEYRKALISFEKCLEINKDEVSDYLLICKEMEIVIADNSTELKPNLIYKMKESQNFLPHLKYYFNIRNMKTHQKLVNLYQKQELSDDEIVSIISMIELDQLDEKLLKNHSFYKRINEEKNELIKNILEVL